MSSPQGSSESKWTLGFQRICFGSSYEFRRISSHIGWISSKLPNADRQSADFLACCVLCWIADDPDRDAGFSTRIQYSKTVNELLLCAHVGVSNKQAFTEQEFRSSIIHDIKPATDRVFGYAESKGFAGDWQAARLTLGTIFSEYLDGDQIPIELRSERLDGLEQYRTEAHFLFRKPKACSSCAAVLMKIGIEVGSSSSVDLSVTVPQGSELDQQLYLKVVRICTGFGGSFDGVSSGVLSLEEVKRIAQVVWDNV